MDTRSIKLLSPAEAALLLKPSSFAGATCLQAALVTLVSRGRLQLLPASSTFKEKRLRVLPTSGESLPAHLTVVVAALRRAGDELKASEVAKALQSAFGTDYRHYIHADLAPSLISGGLLQREDRRFLGLIPYTKYNLTPDGQSRVKPIAQLMAELGHMKRLIREETDHALQLALAAGVLLVLSPAARAQADKLKAMLQDKGDGGSAFVASDSGGEGTTLEVRVDVGDLSAVPDWALMDGICSAGDFTDGGSDGGGDGGGGGD